MRTKFKTESREIWVYITLITLWILAFWILYKLFVE